MTIERNFVYWLRWLAVLPGALLAGMIAIFPLHLVLYNTLSNFVEPYPEMPERILTPLVIAGVFVYAGSRIAPEFKIETSVVLFGLWLFLIGGFVFLTFYGADWFGGQLYFRGGGLSTIMAIVGAAIGLFVVRKQQLEESKT